MRARDHSSRRFRPGLARVWIVLVALPAAAADSPPASGVVQERRVAIEVDVLAVGPGYDGTIRSGTIEIDPRSGGALELRIPWPEPGRESRLRIEATGVAGPPGGSHDVTLQALLTEPAGASTRARRSFSFAEGTTRLFEIGGNAENRLILALRAEAVVRPRLLRGVRIGRPVRFRLEIERVHGERSTGLETDLLHTFVAESVEYSFHRGKDEDYESVRIALRPVRLEGDLAEIEVEVTGTLPGHGSRLALSRQQRLLTTRGASSSITVAAGEPSEGYRFRITPEF